MADTAAPRTYVPFSTCVPCGGDHADDRVAATLFRRSLHRGDVDPSVALYDLTTMNHALDASVSQPRFYAFILGAFASIALCSRCSVSTV